MSKLYSKATDFEKDLYEFASKDILVMHGRVAEENLLKKDPELDLIADKLSQIVTTISKRYRKVGRNAV